MDSRSGGVKLALPAMDTLIEKSKTDDSKVKVVNKYKKNSLGPFIVTVQGSREKNLGNLHPMAIAKEILSCSIQHKKGPLRKGKNRILIEFDSPQAANDFVENEKFREKGFEMFIPSENVSCRAVIRGIYKDLSVEEIRNFTESSIEVLQISRLNRRVVMEGKTEYVPTGTCMFRFEGKIIPNSIKIFGLEMKTEPYMMRVVQCYNCLLYGHIKTQCRSKKKCQRCSKSHEGACVDKQLCYHCNSEGHTAVERNMCPEYERQKQIRFYMSTNGISFYEANQLIPHTRKEIPQMNAKEFPRLGNRQEENVTHAASQRSYLVHEIGKNQKPSYSQKTSFKRPSSRSPSPPPGYSRDLHREALMQPEARMNFPPMSPNKRFIKEVQLEDQGASWDAGRYHKWFEARWKENIQQMEEVMMKEENQKTKDSVYQMQNRIMRILSEYTGKDWNSKFRDN